MNYNFSRMNEVQSPIIPVVGELIKNSPGTISLGQGVVHYQPPETTIEPLASLEDLCTITIANGAFYFFIKVDTKINDLELVKKLVQEYKIAVIPGTTFGMEDGCYLRVAYGALQVDTAKTGIGRLVKGLQSIVL